MMGQKETGEEIEKDSCDGQSFLFVFVLFLLTQKNRRNFRVSWVPEFHKSSGAEIFLFFFKKKHLSQQKMFSNANDVANLQVCFDTEVGPPN